MCICICRYFIDTSLCITFVHTQRRRRTKREREGDRERESERAGERGGKRSRVCVVFSARFYDAHALIPSIRCALREGMHVEFLRARRYLAAIAIAIETYVESAV